MRCARFTALLLAVLVPAAVCAYDFPLSEEAIREAYYLGTKQGSLGETFLRGYNLPIPALKVGDFVSEARIETPYAQVAWYASKTLGYSAQQAIKDFTGKPMVFRMHLDLCYRIDAPPGAIKIKAIQNKKEILASSEKREPYFPRSDKYTHPSQIGEHVDLTFPPEKIDSSDLKIIIDTPDGQHGEIIFPMEELR